MVDKIHVIMPHRPLSLGRMMSPSGKIIQREDGMWVANEDTMRVLYEGTKNDFDKKMAFPKKYSPIGEVAFNGRRRIQDTLKMLNRNSFFNYDIIVAIDSDVYPQENFLCEFDNVKVCKSSFVPDCEIDSKTQYNNAWARSIHAWIDALKNIPDDDWVCIIYADDFLCPKEWDKDIITLLDADKNKKNAYCPFLVEIGPFPSHVPGLEVTSDWEMNYENIWKTWRGLGQAFLIHPPPKRGYIIYSDLEEFIKIAKEPPVPIEGGVVKVGKNIKEKCGMRIYSSGGIGMFVKSEYAKYALTKSFIGPGWDMSFDNYLGHGPNGAGSPDTVFGLHIIRTVVGTSFIFHPSMEYRDL